MQEHRRRTNDFIGGKKKRSDLTREKTAQPNMNVHQNYEYIHMSESKRRKTKKERTRMSTHTHTHTRSVSSTKLVETITFTEMHTRTSRVYVVFIACYSPAYRLISIGIRYSVDAYYVDGVHGQLYSRLQFGFFLFIFCVHFVAFSLFSVGCVFFFLHIIALS